jgi:hypothetical protein
MSQSAGERVTMTEEQGSELRLAVKRAELRADAAFALAALLAVIWMTQALSTDLMAQFHWSKDIAVGVALFASILLMYTVRRWIEEKASASR